MKKTAIPIAASMFRRNWYFLQRSAVRQKVVRKVFIFGIE